ncbi:hypothetical protein DFH08DRAFT_963251 [Mycena albidolilacea]|uniref:SNF2 N-terminal domain-containing protein n=1 Tax=Mycena albidolilacea TaxID=1033008 RepID=A0AAD6ZVN0_9AGAR|nr:hypothetical protein DFH08DRAFT_963251 [Mycena albidolilacea]
MTPIAAVTISALSTGASLPSWKDAHDAHFKPLPVAVTTGDSAEVSGLFQYEAGRMEDGGQGGGDRRRRGPQEHVLREIKKVPTGTPLHNNLTELWSLFNLTSSTTSRSGAFFLLRMNAFLPSGAMDTFTSTLHSILRPVLLRKMKADDVLGGSQLAVHRHWTDHERMHPDLEGSVHRDMIQTIRRCTYIYPSISPVLSRPHFHLSAYPLPLSLFPPNKCYILCARLGARQWEASEATLARVVCA